MMIRSAMFVAAVVACSVVAQPVQWTQRAVSTTPSPRANHAMAFDSARGIAVVFGGDDNNSSVSGEQTWEWNGTTWTQRFVNGPSRRADQAMAFDSARGMTVLFGGNVFGIGSNDETWEWSGTNWAQRAVIGPPPRMDHAMAYDSLRGVIVLFGGKHSGGYFGDTWEWNGTAWTQRAVSGPSPRYDHRMAFDSARGMSVLFGGSAPFSGGNNGETWEWNGTAWTQRSSVGPAPRYVHAMAYDASRGVTVLLGGFTDSNNGETWEWNGTTWAQRAVLGPSGRQGHAMIYDSSRGVTVLFGGYDGTMNGETWEFACVGPLITSQPATLTTCPSGHVAFSVAATTSGTATYHWQWQVAEDSAWASVVSGVNSLASVPQFEATGAATSRLSIRPALAPGGTRLWPSPGYRFRAVISDSCKSVTSNAAALAVCPADFNCDGGIDFFDYLDFVDVFSSALPEADFNEDGGIDFFDYLDFVDAFSIGC